MKRILLSFLACFVAAFVAFAQNDTIPTFDVNNNLTEQLLDQILSSASPAPSYAPLSMEEDKRTKDEVFTEDHSCWEWGDYVIALDGAAYYSSDNTASLKNKVTGEYIIPRLTSKQIKHYIKPGLPVGTMHIAQGTSGWRKNRIIFLDSSKLNTPPELDGLVYIDAEQFYLPSWSKRKTYTQDFTGLYRIEANSLKPVVEMQHIQKYPSRDYLSFDPYSFIRAVRSEELKDDEGNTHRFKVSNLYSFDGTLLKKDVLYAAASQKGDFLWILCKEDVRDLKELFVNKWTFIDYGPKAYDLEMNPLPRFEEYDYLSPRKSAGHPYVVAGKEDRYGAIDEDGKVMIPFLYLIPEQVVEVMTMYSRVGFTPWYRKKIGRFIAEKGEFEKQEHFEARSQNPQMQKEYLLEQLPNAQLTYMEELYAKGYSITLGKYDTERELFPIYVSPGSWNSFTLAIPIDEAQAFKAAFDSVKGDAIKSATFQIRYDTIALEDITFTLPDGKSYTAHIE